MKKEIFMLILGIVLGVTGVFTYQEYERYEFNKQEALLMEFFKAEEQKEDSIFAAGLHQRDSLEILQKLQEQKNNDSLAKIVNPRLLKQEVRKLTTLISQKIPIQVTGFSNNGCTKKPSYYGRKFTLKSGAKIELNASGNLLFLDYEGENITDNDADGFWVCCDDAVGDQVGERYFADKDSGEKSKMLIFYYQAIQFWKAELAKL